MGWRGRCRQGPRLRHGISEQLSDVWQHFLGNGSSSAVPVAATSQSAKSLNLQGVERGFQIAFLRYVTSQSC